MKFGYVWRGSGARSEKDQRKALASYGVPAAKMFRETSPARDERDRTLAVCRPGDEICVVSAAYIADDIVELHWILAALAEREASLYVAEFSRSFVGSKDMADITEDFIGMKRKDQTKAAREKLKKLPRHARGGRPPRKLTEDEQAVFIEKWSNKFVSLNEMAKEFKCHKDKLFEWAGDLGLDEKAR